MLKSLFPFAFTLTPQEIVDRSLSQLQLDSNDPLPQDYALPIFPANLPQSFAALLANLPRATTAPAIIKLFTIVFQTLRTFNHKMEFLICLEEIQLPLLSAFDQKDRSWITEIAIAIKSYLARLPSIIDVFERMASYKQSKQSSPNTLNLSDLYRILNVFGLLFPAVTNCLNIVGRYYAKTYLYFAQFYKCVKEEILGGYEFMQHLVSSFKSSYKSYDGCELQCFMQTVSAIQLYCDRVQQFTMNKYFKGKGPARKIYFRQQELDEINYYLQQLRAPKHEEFNHTKDEEDFGQFQQ